MSNRGDDRRRIERRNDEVRRLKNIKVDNDNEKRSGEERRYDKRRLGEERRND
jgi:hypothetical protein|tara:strand:+ start:51 stop:209 length:159 start_codon:yes stop_codon:yes gene_type:complete